MICFPFLSICTCNTYPLQLCCTSENRKLSVVRIFFYGSVQVKKATLSRDLTFQIHHQAWTDRYHGRAKRHPHPPCPKKKILRIWCALVDIFHGYGFTFSCKTLYPNFLFANWYCLQSYSSDLFYTLWHVQQWISWRNWPLHCIAFGYTIDYTTLTSKKLRCINKH